MSNRLMPLALVLALSTPVLAQEKAAAPAPLPAPIALPAPQTEGGRPLMETIKLRATSRAFAPDPLPAQTLANLLWAGWGISRPADGKRTAPSARNWQEIDVYVLLPGGAYLYAPAKNLLEPVAGGDLRALGGAQDFVKSAPVTLVLVADAARMKGSDAAHGEAYAYADAAFVSENLYLFCASEGLATGVRAMLDRSALAKALALRPEQTIVFGQSVGRPVAVAPPTK
jgi:hypothetical protein